jgi:hypothetical protein
LWILFESPVLARQARVYVRHLAGKLSVQVKGAGPTEGIELFPKQDRIEEGRFGNAIRGPLGIHRAANRRYWFYGAAYDLQAQMASSCSHALMGDPLRPVYRLHSQLGLRGDDPQ